MVTDGRIHPAKIEEVVTKTKRQIEQEIIEIGKRTTIDLGIHGMHHDLIRLIGKMKYTPSEAFHNKGICVGGVYGVNADINIVPTNENYYFLVGINARHYFTKIQYTDKYDYYRNNKDTISNILSKYNDIYLSFPTAIKLKTNPFGRFTIFGVIGLEHGFCLSATSKDEVSPLKTEEEQIFKNVNRTQQTAVFKESLMYAIQDVIVKLYKLHSIHPSRVLPMQDVIINRFLLYDTYCCIYITNSWFVYISMLFPYLQVYLFL